MVLGIAGSGRKNGHSSRLLAEALAGAEAAGLGPQRLLSLAERNFRGCVGCRSCREGASACVLRDGLTEVLEATAQSDAVVLASPIYYGYATGLFKSYLDRWYAFRDPDGRLRVAPERPALLVLTQGNADAAAYSWTRQSLEKVLIAYGFRPSTLVAPSLEGTNALPATPELLAHARSLGAALAKGV